MDLQNPKIRPYLWDLFASEVSYVQNPQGHDWDVMTAWITRMHEMGVEVMFEPAVLDFRQEVLQALWNDDEVRRLGAYDRMQSLPSEALESEMRDILDHQQIITGLMAGDCIWYGD